jgi:hypothetical protein
MPANQYNAMRFSDSDSLAQVQPDEPRFSDMSRTLFFLTEETPVV